PGLAPVIIYVTETDSGIKYTMWHTFVDEGQPTLATVGILERGEVVTFKVSNKGKKPHDFTAFGKKTRTPRPGAGGSFRVALLHRGKFPYASTLDKGKRAFSGVLKVI